MNNNTSDSDLFKIYISNTDAFSGTMTFSRGVNNFASQLAIFDVVGRGVRADDDAANGSPRPPSPQVRSPGSRGHLLPAHQRFGPLRDGCWRQPDLPELQRRQDRSDDHGTNNNYRSTTKTDQLAGTTLSATIPGGGNPGMYTGTLANTISRRWNYKSGYGLMTSTSPSAR